MKFSGTAHSIRNNRHFTLANGDKRPGDLCLRVGHGPVVAEYGVPAPMSGFSIFRLQPGWPHIMSCPESTRKMAVCLERSLVATILTTVTSTVRCAWYKGYRKGTAPRWSDSHSQQSLGSAPTIFELHLCQHRGVGCASFRTQPTSRPHPRWADEGAVSTSDRAA